MKKLYTLSLAALTALSSLAATRSVDFSKMQLITDDALAKSIIGKKVNIDEVKSATPFVGMRKAPARVAAMEKGLGEFDCTYQGLLTSNSGSHEGTANLVWSDQYQDIEVTIPECTLADFGADWDSEAGALVFGQANFGQNGSYYVFQIPLNGGSAITSLSVPFDESQNCYQFNEADGLCFAAVNSSGNIAGYYWAGGNFTIGKSEFDYKLSITADDECSPTNTFAITITAGADVKSIKVIDMPGDYEAAAAATLFAAYGQDIAAGTYNLPLGNAVKETGPYCFLLCGYNADGNAVKYAQQTVIVTVDEDAVYQTIATVPYNNEFNGKYYNGTFTNEAMELQESTETPGKYRLVNPHAGHTYVHAEGCNHYFYLDCTDAEAVSMPFSPSGLDYGDGHLVFGTFNGALGYTKDECTTKGFAVPTLEGRIIKFPASSLLAHESKYNGAGNWSYVNPDRKDADGNVTSPGAFEYTLPDLCLNVTVVDNEGKAVEGAEVAVGDVKAATDAEGVAKLVLPASVDYLDTVEVSAKLESEGYDNVLDAKKEVKLNGANNEYTFATDLSGVAAIEAAAADGEVEYFNLQGVRISNPAKGQVVIARQGSKVSKQLVK